MRGRWEQHERPRPPVPRVGVEIVKLPIVMQTLRSGEHSVREGTWIPHAGRPSPRREAMFDDGSTLDLTAQNVCSRVILNNRQWRLRSPQTRIWAR